MAHKKGQTSPRGLAFFFTHALATPPATPPSTRPRTPAAPPRDRPDYAEYRRRSVPRPREPSATALPSRGGRMAGVCDAASTAASSASRRRSPSSAARRSSVRLDQPPIDPVQARCHVEHTVGLDDLGASGDGFEVDAPFGAVRPAQETRRPPRQRPRRLHNGEYARPAPPEAAGAVPAPEPDSRRCRSGVSEQASFPAFVTPLTDPGHVGDDLPHRLRRGAAHRLGPAVPRQGAHQDRPSRSARLSDGSSAAGPWPHRKLDLRR